MNRSIFQIRKSFSTNNKKNYNVFYFFVFFFMYYIFFYYFINNKIFCFSILQKFEVNNMIIYKSNLVGKNLKNSLFNFKNFYLNFDYNRNFNYFNWCYLEYLEHINIKNKSFFNHPCLIYKDFENNNLIFKHYTKKVEDSRNYDFIYNFKDNSGEEFRQFVSSDYSVLHLNEVIVKTVTNTTYLDQFDHKAHLNNFFKNIKEYKC